MRTGTGGCSGVTQSARHTSGWATCMVVFVNCGAALVSGQEITGRRTSELSSGGRHT
jgi:hypothetical protein